MSLVAEDVLVVAYLRGEWIVVQNIHHDWDANLFATRTRTVSEYGAYFDCWAALSTLLPAVSFVCLLLLPISQFSFVASYPDNSHGCITAKIIKEHFVAKDKRRYQDGISTITFCGNQGLGESFRILVNRKIARSSNRRNRDR